MITKFIFDPNTALHCWWCRRSGMLCFEIKLFGIILKRFFKSKDLVPYRLSVLQRSYTRYRDMFISCSSLLPCSTINLWMPVKGHLSRSLKLPQILQLLPTFDSGWWSISSWPLYMRFWIRIRSKWPNKKEPILSSNDDRKLLQRSYVPCRCHQEYSDEVPGLACNFGTVRSHLQTKPVVNSCDPVQS